MNNMGPLFGEEISTHSSWEFQVVFPNFQMIVHEYITSHNNSFYHYFLSIPLLIEFVPPLVQFVNFKMQPILLWSLTAVNL